MKTQKKLLCWIYGLCFVIVWLFPGKALSQTNNPRTVERCGYNMDFPDRKGGYYTRKDRILPVEFFPWGVCLNGNTSQLEDTWIEYAVNKWNEDYIKYKEKVWKRAYVNGIPGQLFTISCDDSKYNLIYVRKEDLKPDDVLGRYRPDEDTLWDYKYFHAFILMDNKEGNTPRIWERAHFINVMIHELGHGLAIPHMPPSRTELMRTAGFGCEDYKTKNICNFTDADWEKFLWPYNPEEAYERGTVPPSGTQAYKDYMRWQTWVNGGSGSFKQP